MAMAKVIKSGGHQAVRLPKEFRLDEDEVCVKRIGSALLLYPKAKAWRLMEEAIGKVDDDFMADRSQSAIAEERKPL
jgi:antitoxin VapB